MIRQAQEKDFEAILHIRKSLALDLNRLHENQYIVEIQRQGFLRPSDLTLEEYKQDLNKTYIVAEHEEQVVGYLRVDEEQELQQDTKMFWFHPELKEQYFAKPHADIGGIAVLSEFAKHGFATEMLRGVEREVKAKGIPYVFSFVALSPVTNFPSMMFHEKQRFERIAVSEPHTLFGMENYQSFLYGKRL